MRLEGVGAQAGAPSLACPATWPALAQSSPQPCYGAMLSSAGHTSKMQARVSPKVTGVPSLRLKLAVELETAGLQGSAPVPPATVILGLLGETSLELPGTQSCLLTEQQMNE